MLLVMVEKEASLLVNGEQLLVFINKTFSSFGRKYGLRKEGTYCCEAGEKTYVESADTVICISRGEYMFG